MDPKACLNQIGIDIDLYNYSEAVAGLNNYYRWRLKGGFEPLNGDNVADMLANRLADLLSNSEV